MLRFFYSGKYLQKYKNIEFTNLNEPLFLNLQREDTEELRRSMNTTKHNIKSIRVVGLQTNRFGNLRFQVELRQHKRRGRITLYVTPNKNLLETKNDELTINTHINPQVLNCIRVLVDRINLAPVIRKIQKNNSI